MNTIRRNSQGYGYKYCSLDEIHRILNEVGFSYYQEIETLDGNDYIVTHILDEADKEIRKCRGCQVVKVSGKNPAQDYGSALTYARRYSLLLAFGLATADDDGATLTARPDKKSTRPERKAMEKPKVTESTDKPYRKAGIDAIRHLLDTGSLTLSQVQSEVRKYGAIKMNDLDPDSFVRCVASLTQGHGVV